MKLITIIIATYNAEKYIENALMSIKCQKDLDVELVIIDGGSKDRTNEIVGNQKDLIDIHLSERDEGIYDAWNKGIKLSSGKWILFLGADDKLQIGAISKYKAILSNINRNDLHIISGKVQMIDSFGSKTWVAGEPWSWPMFKYRMSIAHPGSLHSRLLFDEYGLYNKEYKIVGDYELLLRPRSELRALFVDEIFVEMMEGGVSDSAHVIKETILAIKNVGGGNVIFANIFGAYIYFKSRLNKVARKFGVNLYRKR